MIGAWVALLLAIAAPAQQAPEPLTPSAFRDRLAAAVRTATGQQTVGVDERTISARKADGTALTISIDNAYQQYLASPADLDNIIAKYSRLLTMKDEANESVDQLVVIVRPSNYIELSVGRGADLKQFPTPATLAGDVSRFLAVDGAETIRLATVADLKRWNLDPPAAWERAVRNHKVRIGPLSPAQLGNDEGADGFAAQSGLASGLLADPSLCGGRGRGAFEGFLALLYSRDVVLIAGRDNEERDRFWRTVRDEVAAARTLSTTPLMCQGGKWMVARP